MTRQQLIGLTAIVAALVVLIALLLGRPSPHEQVDATFARLGTAFAERDAADVFAELDLRYDVSAVPQAGLTPPADEQERLANRRTVQRRLAAYFLFLRQSSRQPRLTWTVHSVDSISHPDHWVAEVSIALDMPGLPGPTSLEQHRFQLVSSGWLFPATRILGHDPVACQRPGDHHLFHRGDHAPRYPRPRTTG